MQCLKCGEETTDSHVFCDRCLAQMESRPIKQGTPVTIYKRDRKLPSAPSKRQSKPEDILPKLLREKKRLVVSVIVLSILLFLSTAGLAWKIYQDFGSLPLGQNYVTETQIPLQTTASTAVN